MDEQKAQNRQQDRQIGAGTLPDRQTLPALDELAQYAQWVVWKYGPAGQKLPINARTGEPAKTNDPATWATFDEAAAACQRGKYAGMGFVFCADDPYTGVDLDDCIADDGTVAGWAEVLIARLASYTEISPSGHGVKLWVRGNLPSALNPNPDGIPPTLKPQDVGGGIEVYVTSCTST